MEELKFEPSILFSFQPHILSTRLCYFIGHCIHSYAGISHSVVSDSLRPHGLKPSGSLCPWDSPGKNTGVDGHSLLQVIFPIQGSDPGLLHCGYIFYCLRHKESPIYSISFGFPGSSVSKESACNAGDLGSIPGSGRSPGEGNVDSLQYSRLENPMDRGAW